jgi:hypothetical protein
LLLPIIPQTTSPAAKIRIDDVTRRFGGEARRGSTEGLVVDGEGKCPVSGKRKYASESEALLTAAHQIATAGAPTELRAYRCSWCDAWHLTKNAGKGGKERG